MAHVKLHTISRRFSPKSATAFRDFFGPCRSFFPGSTQARKFFARLSSTRFPSPPLDSVHNATARIRPAPVFVFPLDPMRNVRHGSVTQRCWINCTLPVSKRQQKPVNFFGVPFCAPDFLNERRPLIPYTQAALDSFIAHQKRVRKSMQPITSDFAHSTGGRTMHVVIQLGCRVDRFVSFPEHANVRKNRNAQPDHKLSANVT